MYLLITIIIIVRHPTRKGFFNCSQIYLQGSFSHLSRTLHIFLIERIFNVYANLYICHEVCIKTQEPESNSELF